MNYLAEGLKRDMKYDESEKVLDCAQKLLGDATGSKCDAAFDYHDIRASSCRLQKRFDESKRIAWSLLRYHEKSMASNVKANLMWGLAHILMKTDREPEAAYWFKKVYIFDMETFDLVHAYAMRSCRNAGFCYAKQGQYHEARLFFGNAIEALTLGTKNVNSRMNCIQEINVWMLKVEEMRAKDPTPRDSVAADSERPDLGINSDDYWREIGEVPGLCP